MPTTIVDAFYSRTTGELFLYASGNVANMNLNPPVGLTARLPLRGLTIKGVATRDPQYLDVIHISKVQQNNETLTPALATVSLDNSGGSWDDAAGSNISSFTNLALVNGGTTSACFVTGVVYDDVNDILYVNFSGPVQGPGLYFTTAGWSGRFNNKALVFNENGLRSLSDPNQIIFPNVTEGSSNSGDSVVSYDGTNTNSNRDFDGKPIPPFWNMAIPSNSPAVEPVSAVVDLSDPFVCEITMSANCDEGYAAIQDGRNWFLRWNGAIHSIDDVSVNDDVVTLTISETGVVSWVSVGENLLAYYGGEDDFLDAEGRAIEAFEVTPSLPS